MRSIEFEEFFDNSSNAKQQYSTHGYFRFFGKLPPTTVSQILNIAIKEHTPEIIFDPMCGSGTVLVESKLRGINSIGVDINPMFVEIARAKTTSFNVNSILNELENVMHAFLKGQHKIEVPEGKTFIHWFEPQTLKDLALLKELIKGVEVQDAKTFLQVALYSIVRTCSKASVRTGRLMLQKDKEIPLVPEIFKKKVNSMLRALPNSNLTNSSSEVFVEVGDAKNLRFKAESMPFVFLHPPYFALYKYSSVYSLELDLFNFSRKNLRENEIREGFKTSDLSKFKDYMDDMAKVLEEVSRITAMNGKLVLVNGNSKLKGEELPVLENTIEILDGLGFQITRLFQRKVSYSQASYHKTLNQVTMPKDWILFAEKVG
jgi:DNA modification methylase